MSMARKSREELGSREMKRPAFDKGYEEWGETKLHVIRFVSTLYY